MEYLETHDNAISDSDENLNLRRQVKISKYNK